jgi:transposase
MWEYRTYGCLQCGLSIDRKLNAALNLQREARRMLVEALHVPVPDSGARSDVKLPVEPM